MGGLSRPPAQRGAAPRGAALHQASKAAIKWPGSPPSAKYAACGVTGPAMFGQAHWQACAVKLAAQACRASAPRLTAAPHSRAAQIVVLSFCWFALCLPRFQSYL